MENTLLPLIIKKNPFITFIQIALGIGVGCGLILMIGLIAISFFYGDVGGMTLEIIIFNFLFFFIGSMFVMLGILSLNQLIRFGNKKFVIDNEGVKYCLWKVHKLDWKDIENISLKKTVRNSYNCVVLTDKNNVKTELILGDIALFNGYSDQDLVDLFQNIKNKALK